MVFVAIACAANIALDVLFMGALKLGPVGAALGTTLSQALSVAAAAVGHYQKEDDSRPRACRFQAEAADDGRAAQSRRAVALQDGLIQVGFIAITIIANMRGLNDSAAVGIVEKIIGILFLVPSTLLSTVSALAALNIGAGEHGRVRQILLYAVAMAVGYGLVIGVTMRLRRTARCRFRQGGGGHPARRGISARLCVGLPVRGHSFQLQRLLLRVWSVGHFVFA